MAEMICCLLDSKKTDLAKRWYEILLKEAEKISEANLPVQTKTLLQEIKDKVKDAGSADAINKNMLYDVARMIAY